MMLRGIFRKPFGKAVYGQDAGELHYPPDENLYA